MNSLRKCQYIGCEKPATCRIVRANMYCCNDHYLLNTIRFGCYLTAESITQKPVIQRPDPPEKNK